MRQLIAAALHPRDYKWGLRPFRRHSRAVLAAGCVYIAIGVAYILTDPSSSRNESLALALMFVPLQTWGLLWIGAGVLAVISSRWPPASETWGYQALSGTASLWAAVYALGVFVMGAPLQSLTSALVWGMVAYLWVIIAGLRNPEDAAVVTVHTSEDADGATIVSVTPGLPPTRAPLVPPRRAEDEEATGDE